jgi:hypothetical protein
MQPYMVPLFDAWHDAYYTGIEFNSKRISISIEQDTAREKPPRLDLYIAKNVLSALIWLTLCQFNFVFIVRRPPRG